MTIKEQLASLAGKTVHVTYYHNICVEVIGVLRNGTNELGKYRVVTGDGYTSFGYISFSPEDVYCVGTHHLTNKTSENCIILVRKEYQ